MLNFATPGEMNLEAMLIHGLSAKTQENAIGRFGTGFKYAIAGVLRLGGKISVHTPYKNYSFTSKKGEHRGKEYNLVHLNGQPLHFTTDLGAHWKPWQLLRELYSNTLDESGEVRYSEGPVGWNQVRVECRALEEAWGEREKYFIQHKPALFETAMVRIVKGSGIYNHGILVYDSPELLWAYDFKIKLSLTEDRTLSSTPAYVCSLAHDQMIDLCEDLPLLECLYRDDISLTEKQFGLHASRSRPVLVDLFNAIENRGNINQVRLCELQKVLFPEEPPKPMTLTPLMQRQLDKALLFLQRAGFEITYTIEVYNKLGHCIHGQAHDGKIKLSKLPFENGTKWLAATILEEQIHLEHGYADCDRNMQNHLFQLLMSAHEERLGEVL